MTCPIVEEAVIVKEALNSDRVVISITGPAAGENEPVMLRRKLAELDSPAKRIFWGIGSYTCSVSDVTALVETNAGAPTYDLFFSGGSPTL